jgi:hypothetical protein
VGSGCFSVPKSQTASTVISSGPATPSATLVSPVLSNQRTIYFTINSCDGIEQIMVNSGTVAPPLWSDDGWVACTTTPSGISYTVPDDGTFTINLWGEDSEGNISQTPTQFSVTVISTPPAVTLTSMSGGQVIAGGTTVNITYTATDNYFAANPIEIDLSTDGGGTFAPLPGATHLANTGSFSYAVPAQVNGANNDNNGYLFRVQASDTFGNVGSATSASAITVATSPPQLYDPSQEIQTIFSIDAGESSTNDPFVTVKLTGFSPYVPGSNSVPLDNITQFCLKRVISVNSPTSAPPTAPTSTDPCWTPVDAPLPGLTPSGRFSMLAFPYFLGTYVDATYPTYYVFWAWVMDAAGNISTTTTSAIPPTTGNINVGTSTIDQMASVAGVAPGMLVTGPGIPTGSYVASVTQAQTGPPAVIPSITIANAAGSPVNLTTPPGGVVTNVAISFFNVISTTASLTNASAVISSVAQYGNLAVGMAVSGTGIPPNTYVVSGAGTNSLTLNNKATQTGTGVKLIFTQYGTLGHDVAHIQYTGPAAPSVSSVVISNTPTPNTPPLGSQLIFTSGSNIYIKWTVALPDPANSTCSIYLTTDDVTWTQLFSNIFCSGIDNISCNATGASGCDMTSHATFTPPAGYFRVRVVASDTVTGTSAWSDSPPANTSPINGSSTTMNVLGGNTTSGVGLFKVGVSASAWQGSFVNQDQLIDPPPSSSSPNAGRFVISSLGALYILDSRGLLFADPTPPPDNALAWNLQLVVPTSGTMSGGLGQAAAANVASATLGSPSKITIDYQDNVYILDSDGAHGTQIRMVNTHASPMTIQTVVGGGTSAADGSTPLTFKISTFNGDSEAARTRPFFMMPNGDLYFQAENYDGTGGTSASSYRLRYYSSSLNAVESYYFTGTAAVTGTASQDISACRVIGPALGANLSTSAITLVLGGIEEGSGCGTAQGTVHTLLFDPNTFAVTGAAAGLPSTGSDQMIHGMDGNIYGVSRSNGQVEKYDAQSNTWVRLVGIGTVGSCPSGTAVATCAIEPSDLFVSQRGDLFFNDRGVIRTLDPDGAVRSLYGQSYSSPNATLPDAANFHTINTLATETGGGIMVLDRDEHHFIEFTPNGGFATIAGDGYEGTPSTTVGGTLTGFTVGGAGVWWDSFALDPATNGIFYNFGPAGLGFFSRATAKWAQLVGGGATPFASADGLAGSGIDLNFYPPTVLGYDGTGKVLAVLGDYNGTLVADSFLKTYTSANGTQGGVMGVTGPSPSSMCAPGTAGTACGIPHPYGSTWTGATWDALGAQWAVAVPLDASDPADASKIYGIAAGGNLSLIATLAQPARAFAYRHDATDDTIYYCSQTDGKIHRDDLINNAQAVTASAAPVYGTFGLTFNGQTVSGIPYNVSAAALQADLVGLSSIGANNATVTGSWAWGFEVQFAGTLAGVSEPEITASSTLYSQLLPATVTVSGSTTLSIPVSGSPPVSGTFDLAFNNGTTTKTATAIPFSVDATTLQSDLEGLSTIGVGNVTVTGSWSGGGFDITLSTVTGTFTTSNNTMTYPATPVTLGVSSDFAYPWPTSKITCAGRSVVYDATRNSIVFPFYENGLMGVGEITPP